MAKSTMLEVNIASFGSRIAGFLAPMLIPPLHIAIFYHLWQEYSREVDKQHCTCSCWDTVFKGSYETGVASYKHMYFNATSNSFKIWLLIVFGTIITYEVVRYLAWLIIKGQVRYSMIILFSSTIFSHYYAWWIYINYWNDDFYNQWSHQTFFTLTELFSTIFVIHLANDSNRITYRKIMAIVSIAILHILAGGWDNFVTNVFRGAGYSHQIIRDFGFMIPDILHVCIPLWCLKQRASSHSSNLLGADSHKPDLKRDLFCSIIFIVSGLCICALL